MCANKLNTLLNRSKNSTVGSDAARNTVQFAASVGSPVRIVRYSEPPLIHL